MARQAKADPAKDLNLPANVAEQLPAMDGFFDGDDGFAGVGREDIALPRLTIIQALSPQLNKRNDEYIEGAEIGMILNAATGALYDEYPAVFAAYQRRYVEWTPRSKGGGLVMDHGVNAAILEDCEWDEDEFVWRHGENEVIVTGTWYGIDPNTLSPFFMACGKTHYTASKKIMAAVRDQKYHDGKLFRPAPLFAREWILSSRERSNDKGTWSTWKATPGRWVPRMEEGGQRDAVMAAIREMQKWVKDDLVTVDMSLDEDVSGGGTGTEQEAM